MPRTPTPDKILFAARPKLVKEWHPTKNGELTPYDVAVGSNKKVWWKCDNGEDHEWESRIMHRSNGSGCPVCAGQKVVKSNCLATINPELAKEWHPTKNEKLTPFDITAGANKKVWWKCDKGDDHEWQSIVSSRSRGNGCPVCNNLKTVHSNCLATINPELAKEWHPTKNEKLTPFDVTANSHKKVWWKCNKGDDHEWQSAVKTRSNGHGCPICYNRKAVHSNCLATLNPELAKEWHPTKNENLTPFEVTINSHKKVWWKCDKGVDHEWKSSIKNRSNGSRCPVCAGQKIVNSNCLATLNPELAKEWHPIKNKDLTPFDVTEGTKKKVWWKCEKGVDHEWQSSIGSRSHGDGCPVCSGLKVVFSNCLATTNPELAKEWHPSKNGTLTPFEVTAGSSRIKIWWKCEKGVDHEWQSAVSSRSAGRDCPVCSGHKVVQSNCLATTSPEIAKEWHPTKNGNLTPFDVTTGSSHKKVWWKCKNGDDHEWRTTVNNRSTTNCPYCTLTPQSKQELTITFELMQFFHINPKGFKTKVNGKLWSVDIYIPEINLGIEFDGSYWHKGKRELDKLKTEQLQLEGFNIIRVRQEPIKRIFETDIMATRIFNGKQITDDILNHILKYKTLTAKTISKINKYLTIDCLQNEKALDRYIDIILEEKVERKAKRNSIDPELH